MESLTTLYKEHIATLQTRAREILQRSQLDALLIHSGELLTTFLDDHSYPFKVNPQFKAWVPVTQVPNCWLWVDGVNAPKLVLFAGGLLAQPRTAAGVLLDQRNFPDAAGQC